MVRFNNTMYYLSSAFRTTILFILSQDDGHIRGNLGAVWCVDNLVANLNENRTYSIALYPEKCTTFREPKTNNMMKHCTSILRTSLKGAEKCHPFSGWHAA